MKKVFAVILLIFVSSFLFVSSGCDPKGGVNIESRNKEKTLYQCSMHPWIISEKPENCPICGMKLTRIEKTETQKAAVTTGDSGSQGEVPGHAEITITPERQQLIGLQIAEVAERPLSVRIRAVGRVAYDPELYNTLTEYREAVNNLAEVKDNPFPGVRERAEALVRSSEIKLKLLGISTQNGDEIFKTENEETGLLLPEKTAWVYADIYQYESGLVKPGDRAKISSPAFPGKTFEGQVRTVDPILNAMSRTLRVRIAVENKELVLKPEMFVDVAIDISLGTKLSIPEEALFNAGETQLVFVEKHPGHIVPREIHVGHEASGYYEVLEGLSKGERVVSSANFLIDSESRLRAAVKGFEGQGQKAPEGVHQH